MRRRLLLITFLGLIGLASAQGEGSPFGVLAGSTVTCSATPSVAGCYLERAIATLGPVEFTVGIDTQAAYAAGRTGHLAPYVGAAWYGPTWSMWAELYLPRTGVPTLGNPDWFRIGFSWRFE